MTKIKWLLWVKLANITDFDEKMERGVLSDGRVVAVDWNGFGWRWYSELGRFKVNFGAGFKTKTLAKAAALAAARDT